MQKTIRALASIIIGIFILLAILVIGLVVFINPNDYKPQITQKVLQVTGRQLTFNGDIHWSFFPWVGLQINKTQLSNATGFGNLPFLQIDQADIKIQLVPLFKGIISVGDVTLDGLQLNLIKNTSGITNWQDLSNRFSAKNKTPAKTSLQDPTSTVNQSTSTHKKINFNVAAVDISNGHITWLDMQKGQAVIINHLDIQSKNIKIAQDFPVQIQFEAISKQPEMTQDIKFDANAFIDPDQKNYLLKNIKLENNAKGDIFPGGKFTLDAEGALTITQQEQMLNLAKISANVNNTNITGNMQVLQLTTVPIVTAYLNADRFQQKAFEASNITLKLNMANKIIHISPITASLYQGNYLGNIIVNLNGKNPFIISDSQLTGVQTEPLFNALSNERSVQLTGTANLNAHLTMQGDSKDTLIKTLNGQGKIAVNNGVLKGLNLSYWINFAKSLLSHQAAPVQPITNQTDFGNLTGTFIVTNGVLQNNDLLLQAPNWRANGNGAINLVNQQLNYKLTIQSYTSTNQPTGTPIALEIKGPFTQLAIRPAVEDILKAQIQMQADKNKDKIQQLIQKNLPKDLGNSLQQQLNNFLH